MIIGLSLILVGALAMFGMGMKVDHLTKTKADRGGGGTVVILFLVACIGISFGTVILVEGF